MLKELINLLVSDNNTWMVLSVTVWYFLTQSSQHTLLLNQVQDVPNEKLKGDGIFAGPVLHLSCSQGGEFQKPVTITMPVSLRRDANDVPDLSKEHVRIFYQTSSAAVTDWRDVTHELESPADLRDGVVTFQVKHFCV